MIRCLNLCFFCWDLLSDANLYEATNTDLNSAAQFLWQSRVHDRNLALGIDVENFFQSLVLEIAISTS